MNEYLHDIHPDSNEGWQQMQFLLDHHLPVESTRYNRKNFFIYGTAAIILGTLLCTSLKFGNELVKEAAPGTNVATIASNGKSNLPAPASYNVNKTFYLVDDATKSHDHLAISTGHGKVSGLIGGNNFMVIPDITTTNGKIENGIIEKQSIKKWASGSLINFQINDQLAKQIAANKKITSRQLSWYAGIGTNIALSTANNLQPYPFAEARYSIGHRFYLAAGVALWSPVATKVSGISKTVFLNDTVNNIRLYNEISTYKHLSYADMSLSAGVNITKHLSLQTGMQSSVLMNKKVEKKLMPYDYQLNSMSPTNLPATTAAASGQDFNVQPNQVDYRVTGAVRYTQNKTTIGLSYQHGLQPAGKGDNAKRNKLISLTVAFKLK